MKSSMVNSAIRGVALICTLLLAFSSALPAVAALSDTTPNIIIILTDFHVSPTCSPTRSALFTVGHEFKNGTTHTIHERERMSLEAVTLAQVLQFAGYTTGIFGKWHLGDESAYQPGRRGFDEVFIHGGGGIGQTYPGSCGDVPDNKYFDPVIKFIRDGCSIRNNRFSLVRGEKDWQLFDLKQAPGQSDDIAARQHDVVKQWSTAYDQWWADVLPHLVNEDAYKSAPAVNPFKQDYWNQFGGDPQPSTRGK